MEDKPVKPIIKRDLASEPTFFRGPFGKLKQIGLHAAIGKASDPVDPCGIDMDVTCGTSALATTIAVDTRNIVEQCRFARRHAGCDFNGKPATVVGNKGDLDHRAATFPLREIQCA
jgi:hypothetical protein